MKVAVVLLCSLLPLFFYEFVQGMSRPIDNVYGTCSEDDGAFSEDDGDGDYVPGEEVRSNDSLLYLLVSPRPTRPRRARAHAYSHALSRSRARTRALAHANPGLGVMFPEVSSELIYTTR